MPGMLVYMDEAWFPLFAPRTVVGRRPRTMKLAPPSEERFHRECSGFTDHLAIAHPPLSTSHFEVIWMDIEGVRRHFLRDVGSCGGSSVNHGRVGPEWVEARPGDRLVHDWFRLEEHGADEEACGKLWWLMRALHRRGTVMSAAEREAFERELDDAVAMACELGFDQEAERLMRFGRRRLDASPPEGNAPPAPSGPPEFGPPPGY